jgi:FkbM family methyltransferase
MAPPDFGTYSPSILQNFVAAIGHRLPPNYLGRRLSAWLRWLLQVTANAPIDVVVMDFRMRLRLDNNACERRLMVTPQFFDPHDLEILKSRIGSDFSFVDLGANVGTYSLFVARHAGPSAKLLAVEPHPTALARLQENITLNGFNVDVASVAVAAHDGQLELLVDSNNLGVTSYVMNSRPRGSRRFITAPVRTLQGLVQDFGFDHIDALKADIEGAEDRALLPFFAAAPKHLWPRLLIIELNRTSWKRDLISELEQLGFRRILSVATNNCVMELD